MIEPMLRARLKRELFAAGEWYFHGIGEAEQQFLLPRRYLHSPDAGVVRRFLFTIGIRKSRVAVTRPAIIEPPKIRSDRDLPVGAKVINGVGQRAKIVRSRVENPAHEAVPFPV